jgi:arginine deiminase
MTLTYGVHSEAGQLRRVLVHRPGSEMARLTPANAESLLFDDVLWVKQARVDHMEFVDALRERGVEVVLLREMLEEVLTNPEARRWLLEARINDDSVGVGLSADLLACLMEMPAKALSHILIGGMSRAELPIAEGGVVVPMLLPDDFLLAPMPNTIFTRDSSCWIYGGVTLNPMFWPARRLETLNLTAIYRFHPDFAGADFPIWFGDPMVDHGAATLEGGDVMPIGNGTVLIGMGERAFCGGRGGPGHRLPVSARALIYASRYGVHLLRPRSGHGLCRSDRRDPDLFAAARRQRHGAGHNRIRPVPRGRGRGARCQETAHGAHRGRRL